MRRIILTTLLFSVTVRQVYGGTNQAAAIFLVIYPGARQTAMAGAFTAVADDAVATYYNDGGLAFQKMTRVTYMHVDWLPGLARSAGIRMYYEFASLVRPLEDGVFGAQMIYLNSGNTVAVDETGRKIDEWTTFDAAVKLSYATLLSDNIGLGIGWKFIYSFLAKADVLYQMYKIESGGTGKSWAFDLSVLYKSKILDGLQVGIALHNLGPGIRYTNTGESDPLPYTWRFGIAYRGLLSNYGNYTISGELTKIFAGFWNDVQYIKEKPNEGWTYVWHDTWKSIGAEVNLLQIFSLRVGYFWDVEGHRVGPTFGAGIGYKNIQFDIGVDAEIYEFPTDNYHLQLSYAW